MIWNHSGGEICEKEIGQILVQSPVTDVIIMHGRTTPSIPKKYPKRIHAK